MSGIFGIIRRDGDPAVPEELARMGAAIAAEGGDAAGLAIGEPSAGVQLSAAGRLDNRDELLRELGLGEPELRQDGPSDADVILAAYRRWGQRAPARLIGDWRLAAWHPDERKLFVARDPFGYGSLYYYADARRFAFAPSAHVLLALGIPLQLDELFLAQYLVSWPAYHGHRTSVRSIRRLPPAHAVTVTAERLEIVCYRQIEQVSELRLSTRSEYVEGLRDVFDEAVRVRLPTTSPVAVTLSGGLDSGSVAVTAARQLGEAGRRLLALTAVPVADTSAYVGRRFGDELPFARVVAASAGNIDLRTLDSKRVSPIQGIRWALDIFGAPVHAAASQFWLLDLQEIARDQGCKVLLTGQLGNASLSWSGSPLSQPWRYQLEHLGPRRMARTHLRQTLPQAVLARRALRRHRRDPDAYRGSAIHPDFARRLRLQERRLEDREEFPLPPVAERLTILKPGRSLIGDVYARLADRFGVEARDPTADVRVIQFVLSVPDRIFIDPATGTDRWLIREAMTGRLPDEVRLNRRRGRQAGDLVPRLRATGAEVETALDELDGGPAAQYVDVAYMREVWTMIQREDTPDALRKAVSVVTRGIMGGLHVNALARGALS